MISYYLFTYNNFMQVGTSIILNALLNLAINKYFPFKFDL